MGVAGRGEASLCPKGTSKLRQVIQGIRKHKKNRIWYSIEWFSFEAQGLRGQSGPEGVL